MGYLRSGPSVLEFGLGFFAFFVGLAGLYYVAEATTSSTIRDRATDDARAYAAQMHPGLTRVVCQSVDSDGDGYVTCTVGDGAGRTEGVECRATVWMDYGRGCRPMRAAVRTTGTTR